jgi:hypothetical protein
MFRTTWTKFTGNGIVILRRARAICHGLNVTTLKEYVEAREKMKDTARLPLNLLQTYGLTFDEFMSDIEPYPSQDEFNQFVITNNFTTFKHYYTYVSENPNCGYPLKPQRFYDIPWYSLSTV